MRYVTKKEMHAIDKDAIHKRKIPAVTLMENAGKAVADAVLKLQATGKIAVFCGYGNNGGDGFVAARLLKKSGMDVAVLLLGKPKTLSHETNTKLEELLSTGTTLNIITGMSELDRSLKALGKPGAVIDAIFGIGFKGPLDDLHAEVVDQINALGSPVVSVDIPSGLDADSGLPMPIAVKASVTVTMGYPKKGFLYEGAKEYLGEVIVADIGLAEAQPAGPAEPKDKKISKEKTISVRSGKSGKIRPGHPWIYKEQLRQYDRTIKPGEIVKVVSSDMKFIGRGYFNPSSEISVRLLTFKDEPVNEGTISDRIYEAVARRKPILERSNAYKAVYSEADGLPGLIVDVYGDTVVFQVLTLGMERMKGVILDSIVEAIGPKYIYEKSQSPFRKLEGLTDISTWHGEPGSNIVQIHEGKVKFLVDIVNGHKTGFYLDQRRSRASLENFVKGKKVLDLFCYTGGFSVSAAAYGAEVVRGIDIKEEWLKLAAKNAELNGVSGITEFVPGDVFDVLRDINRSGERFDIIVLDPPSFLKSRADLASASRGYKDLNLYAMKTLAEGGMLCTFSCSHYMPNDKFAEIIKSAAHDAKKKTEIVKRCHQAEDHPIVRAIPETEYLKGYFLKISSI